MWGGGQYSHHLLGLVVIWVEPIGRQLFDVALGQASELGLTQPLGQVQQGLWSTPQHNEESLSRWRGTARQAKTPHCAEEKEGGSLFVIFTADFCLFQ